MAGLSRAWFGLLWLAAGCTQAGDGFYPDFQKLSAALYQQQPAPAACQTGVLLDTQKQQVLATLNAIRALHGLAPVRYEETEQESVMQTALLMAGIGHRRWLLDPFLKRIAYGRVSGAVDGRNQSVASVLKILRPDGMTQAATAPELIAYPYGDYPARFYAEGAPISVALMIDAGHKAGNAAVDFSQTRIAVKPASGKPLRISGVIADNRFYGLPNNLQFRAERLVAGERYEVMLDGVRVKGEAKTYRYWFRIVP